METLKNGFFRNDLHDVIKVAGIYTIHYFRYGKNFDFPFEQHDFWELVFIDSGTATIYQEDKEIRLLQSEIIFHKPNASHTIKTRDEFCNSVIVSFDASGRMLMFLEDKIFKLNEYEKGLLKNIVLEGNSGYKEKLNLVNQKKMDKNANAPFGCEQVIKNNLELLLISIIRNNLQQNGKIAISSGNVSAHAEQIVEKILNILESKIKSSVNLDDIAKELFFSKTYIKSVFKRYTGQSIIQYYNKMKIDEAKKLISQGKHTFIEISLELGFSSVHYFTRLFKSVTQMSPSQYKNSIQVDNILD